MKQSPLLDLHRQQGAKIAEQDGWQLADHFGKPTAEYQGVRTAAGLFDMTHRAMLQFTGPDRVSFLQGLLSNDVRQLNPFDGQQAALLTQQGKVVADVRVLCAMNSIYLDFREPLQEKLLAHVNRYLVADEVEIHDPNEQWKMLSIQGPLAKSVLDRVFAGAQLPTRVNGHGMVNFDGASVCAVRTDRTGYNGFDLIVQAEQLASFAKRLNELGAVWVGAHVQEILRIEAGIPRYGVDFDEDNLLLEVGLDDAVSFTKGCYLGQEIIERIRSRGHINKKLCGLLFDGRIPASRGDAIRHEDKVAGEVTSSVTSLALGRPIALGYLNREFWSEGTSLTIEHDRNKIAAMVTRVPFVVPARAT